MRLAAREPGRRIDLGQHLLAGGQFALVDQHLVHHQALDRSLHVEHVQLQTGAADRALVGVLTTGLGVEGGLVQHHLDHVARL